MNVASDPNRLSTFHYVKAWPCEQAWPPAASHLFTVRSVR